MLRGPQTVGELRGRTERMHEFTDLEEVERCLESLAAREPEPLVARCHAGAGVICSEAFRTPLTPLGGTAPGGPRHVRDSRSVSPRWSAK